MSDTLLDTQQAPTQDEAPQPDNIEPLAGEGPVEEGDSTSDPVSEEVPEDSGVGEGDSLFFGKYKSYEDAEKGFKELQSKLREKAPEAPEEYAFDFKEDEDLAELGEEVLEGLDPKEDPRFGALEDVFKKHNLSQEAVADIVKAQIKQDFESMPDLEAEANSLGDEREVILANANMFVQKHLNADEQEIAKSLGQSAAGVKFLYKMSQMSGEKQVPADVTKQDPRISSSELYSQAFAYRDEVGNFEYNKGAQSRYDEMLSAAVKREQQEKQGR